MEARVNSDTYSSTTSRFRLCFGLNLMPFGSWPLLVKRGSLEVSKRFPVHRKGGKTTPLLRESSSIPLVDVPVLSTSPKVAKSPGILARFAGACCCCEAQTVLLPRCSAHAAPYRYTLFDVWSPPSQRLRVGSASAWRSSAIRSASGASRVNSRSMPLGSLIYTERQ
jgi:hypothetical protein